MRQRKSVLIFFISLILGIVYGQGTRMARADGLHYNEILHFYVDHDIHDIAHVNEPAPRDKFNTTADYAISLDFSADGKTLAVGYGGVVRWWDVATGTLQNTLVLFDVYPGTIPVFGTRVRYSPNGQYIAITAWSEADIYDKAAKQRVQTCAGFIDAPFSWSPDSHYIAGSDTMGHLLICDVQTGHIETYSGLSTSAAQWSPNGKYILVLSDSFDYTSYMRLFNVQTGQVDQTLLGEYSADWDTNSTAYISYIPHSSVTRIHDVTTGYSRVDLPFATDALAWYPSGQRIASFGDDDITISDARKGYTLAKIAMQVPDEPFISLHRWLVWNRDGSLLAAIDQQRVVHIWRESGTPPIGAPPTNTPHPINIQATWTPVPTSIPLTLAQLPSKIVARGAPNAVPLWYKEPSGKPPYLQPRGNFIIDFNENQQQWMLYQRNNQSQPLRMLGSAQSDVSQASWSPDGRYVAVVRDSANLDIYDLQGGQLIDTVHHDARIIEIVWHPTQPWIASAGSTDENAGNGKLIVRDYEAHKTLYLQHSPLDLGSQFAWMGSTHKLLVWGFGAGLFTLDVLTSAETTLFGFDSQPLHLIDGRLSPDNRYLAYTIRDNNDHNIYFLDLWTATIVRMLPYSGDLTVLSWSPDGSQLATNTDDFSLLIWGN